IEKRWHKVHFLLTGSASGGEKPLYNVVLGGREVGEDLGYGPTRYLTASQVQEVVTALEPVNKEMLRARVVPEMIKKGEIYCWDDDDPQGDLEDALNCFEEIRSYFQEASKKGNGMLLILN